MTPEDLLRTTAVISPTGSAAPDALREDGALQEAQLLDVRFDAVNNSVGLLFELRTSLQYDDVSTGVLIARAVTDLTWTAPPRADQRTAWNILSSHVDQLADRLTLTLSTFPDGELRLVCGAMLFAVGTVPGLGDTIADYAEDDDATVREWTATWSSRFETFSSTALP